MVGCADGVFRKPNEDLEDAEVFDRLEVGRELVSFANVRHSDVCPGGTMDGQHVLLGINVVVLGNSRARLLTLCEASCSLVDLDTQELFVGIV